MTAFLKNILSSWPVVATVFLLVFFLKSLGVTAAIDRQLYDYTLRLWHQDPPSDVAIIAIDEKSIDALGRWPWSRDIHAQLISQLADYQPKALVFDILFIEPSQNPAEDVSFAESMRLLNNIILPVYIGNIRQRGDAPARIFQRMPLPMFTEPAAALGHVQIDPDDDGVTRSFYLYQEVESDSRGHFHWPHIALAIQKQISGSSSKQADLLQLSKLQDQETIKLVKREKKYISFMKPTHTVDKFSYVDVLLGRIPRSNLDNKIVFVGATAAGLGDDLITPMTGSGESMSGVEGHVNVLHALRENQLIDWLDETWALFWSVLVLLVLITFGSWISARKLLLVSIFLALATLISNFVALRFLKLWLPSSFFLLGILLIYPAWSFYRLTQAVNFLKEELFRVKQAQPIFEQPEKLIDVQTMLNSLLHGGQVNAWWVDQGDNRRLISGGDPHQYAADFPSSGFWMVDGKPFQWAISWASEEAYKQFEKRIGLNLTEPVKEDAVQDEVVSMSIDYLRSANRQVRSMYNMSRATLQHSQGAVLVLDVTGRVLFVNDNARRLFNLSEVTQENNHVFYCFAFAFDDVPENNRAAELIRALLFEQQSFRAEVTGKQEQFFLLQGDRAKLSMDVEVALLTFSDITQVKRLQKARAEALHFLSHDLRSPMVSILALLDQMKTKGEIDPKVLEVCTELAETNLEYANNYLQVVRAEEGEMKTDVLEAVGIFETAISHVYAQAKATDVQIINKWPNNIVWVEANVNLISRALQNLLDNAIKYSPKFSRVEVTLLETDAMVGFSVSDSGMGIPEHELPTLLESFQRASNAKESNIPGTGLGLRFVDVVSKRHGGYLDVKSTLNQGSVFILWLPKATEYVE